MKRITSASIVVAIVILVVCLALSLAPPRMIVVPIARLSPQVLYFVDSNRPAVALTIDDGPAGVETDALLDLLSAHDARATFFLIGDQVPGNETLLRRMIGEGHEIASHGFRERASILLSRAALETDLATTHTLLSEFGAIRWFRPASGFYDAELLELVGSHGYRSALGDVYPFDAFVPFSGFHAWYVLHHVKPGSVIVMHDGAGRGWRTIDALQVILPELQKRGFEVVTLSELVSGE